jgi:hypothetical protein
MGDVVLDLGLFGGGFLRERPGQHELGLEHGFCALHDAVEGCRHPGNGRMLDLALDVDDAPAGVALVPGAVELFGGGPKLHDEVAGQVVRLGLAPFLPPKADQGRFVTAHDDPGVRIANEGAAALVRLCPHIRSHDFLRFKKWGLVSSSNYAGGPYGATDTIWAEGRQAE